MFKNLIAITACLMLVGCMRSGVHGPNPDLTNACFDKNRSCSCWDGPISYPAGYAKHRCPEIIAKNTAKCPDGFPFFMAYNVSRCSMEFVPK